MKEKEEDCKGLTRRDFLYLSGASAAGIAMAGMPELGHGAEKKPKYGGRLRMSERYGSMGLDCHKNQDFIDYQNYCLMYGGLAEMGKYPDIEMNPMLAKSWEISRDGREYIFNLREGIKFHHGKELDSGDVKYSIDRVMNPATRSPRGFAFRWIESVQIIDKYNLKIRLKEPYAPFLSTLSVHNCSIIPAGWEPTGMKPAPGTGPFVFKSFVPNETTEYTRFDQYWEYDEKTGDRLPYLGGINLKKIVDTTVSYAALRAGDLDVISAPPLHIAASTMLGKPVAGIVMDFETPGNLWIWFNVSKPPFDNKKVRQAIAYGLDKKEIVKSMWWGLGGTVNNQPFLDTSRFNIPVEDRKTDLTKAKELLAEAGYPNGLKVEFLESSAPYPLAGAEAIIGQLKKIGIEGSIRSMDRAPHVASLTKGDYNISFDEQSERYDWDDAYYMYFHSNEIGKSNFSRYSNKELDVLLENGRTTMKWEDRVAIYKKVVDTLKEDLPVYYITKSVVVIAFRDYLKGYRKGFTVRFAWTGGGIKYWWLDK